jgi:hypothetical protein
MGVSPHRTDFLVGLTTGQRGNLPGLFENRSGNVGRLRGYPSLTPNGWAMKKLPLLVVCVLLLSVSGVAQTSSPVSKQITVLADFSDRGQFAIENRLFAALEQLEGSGSLKGFQLESAPLVINTGQADGKALLSKWGLSDADLPLLAITTVSSEGGSPALLWYWRVDSVPEAVGALQAELGVDSSVALPRIRAADFSPKVGPLSAGQSITVTLQGTEGCTATFDVGGAVGQPLFELQSGLYRGEYLVKPDDRTDAAITVHLTADGGSSVSKLLGQMVLQGFQAPHVQSVRQLAGGEWLVAGTAPPNSLVSVKAVMSQTLIFKFKSVTDFAGKADNSGQFQLTAFIEDNVGGSEGTFTATATLGNVTQTSTQKMVFQGLPKRYNPPSAGPSFSPWSLAGRWYHRDQPTKIRVEGAGSVVIRNEFGQETVMNLRGLNRLESRGAYRLNGRVEGQTIYWDNGTRWERSRFR